MIKIEELKMTASRIIGSGSAIGSVVLSNADLGDEIGIGREWFETHTGIRSRRACAADESASQLATLAVTRCLSDAGLSTQNIGSETVLFHIHNGLEDFTPPPAIKLAESLGLERVRVISIDGVCSEPIPAIEFADLMLRSGRCERAIVSASADFLSAIDKQDRGTAGLFGAGAGALLLGRGDGPRLGPAYWENRPQYSDLGTIPVKRGQPTPTGFTLDVGFYEMNGNGLVRAALKSLPETIQRVLDEADLTRDDIDLIIAHQPNVRMIEVGFRALGLDLQKTPMPVVDLGNMGPASILVNYDIAKKSGVASNSPTTLLLAFGLGFSCGAQLLLNDR